MINLKKEENESMFKSSFFIKLFGIPSAIWLMICLLAMVPEENEVDPLTWGDFVLGNIFIISCWFAISSIIYFIVTEFKKRKAINESQYTTKFDEIGTIKSEEMKKEAKKTSKENYLYACDSEIDDYEYKKMTKYFSKMTLSNVLFKLGRKNTKINYEFYDDYFITKGENEAYNINYSDIDRSIETDTNFYLRLGEKNKIIIIQKNSCDLELVYFIREKFENMENRLADGSSFKGLKKYHNPKFVKRGMIILFILTLLSLWGATYSLYFINKLIPQHGFNFVKNTWIFWCWLPLPVLSIILGFKYKHAGYKCTKNIVGGFIMGFLLLIYGSFSLFPTFEREYSEIDSYRDIIDADLPSNGELEIQEWGTYFDEDKTEYIIINAYYDKEDVTSLVNSIENNNNWILSKEIKSELKILIPSELRTAYDAYYSIYNKTTNQYNTIPETEGNYEIYAMKYDKSKKQLEIHRFYYSYK